MNLFRRRPAAPPTAAPSHRAHLEDDRRLSLRGWALAADGGHGQLELWLRGRPLAVEIRRVERPDVLAHLGRSEASDKLRPGFEVELHAGVWRAVAGLQGPIDGELRVDGQPVLRFAWWMSDEELATWARELIEAPPSQAGQERAWRRLAGFLSDEAGSPLPGWAWVWQAWAGQGGAPGERAEGRVEEVDGVLISGWASDPTGQPERFTVHCMGRTWPIEAARFERRDVAQALPTAAALAGFVLSLPPDLWSMLPPQGAGVQLCVNQRPLLVPPLNLAPAHLEQWLAAAERKAAQAVGGDRHDAVQTLAVLRQHAGAARLNELAAGPSDPAIDEDVAGLWALQRAFNECLGEPGASALTAWEALRGSPPSASRAAWRRFTLSLVPAFCGLNELGVLRADLDVHELATLAHADGAWELSLLLPVAVMDELAQGRVTQGTALLGRIARALPAGWLNTESLADSVRRVRGAMAERALDDAELRAFIRAVLQVYDAIGLDVWSRSSDRFLSEGMVELLLLADGVDEALASDVRQAALQRHANEPAFWRRWRAERSLPPALDALAHAATTWRAALDALQRAGSGSTNHARWVAAWQALRPFEACGLSDLPLLRRHLLALAPAGDEASLGTLPAELADADRLRRWPQGPGSEDRWRALLAVPPQPLASLADRLVDARRCWHESLEQGDAAALVRLWPGLAAGAMQCVRLASGFAGLLVLAELWHGTACWPELRADLALRMVSATEQAMDMVDRRRHELGAPPAALLAALAWLQLGGLPGGPERARPLVERLQAHWPAWAAEAALPWPAEERLGPAEVPGVSALVVVRLATGGDAAMRRVATGLGAALTQRGIGWCVWQPTVADSARGFVAADLWQALDWLTRHTRAGHFCFVDDDVELAIDAWLAAGGATHHLHGMVHPADAESGRLPFVNLGLGLGLSRTAALAACRLSRTHRGARLQQRLGDDAAVLAELLHWLGVQPSAQAHVAHIRRPPKASALPRLFHNAWLPGPGVPTVLTTRAPDDDAMPPSERWGPARIWPPDQPPRLPGGEQPAQQLVRLSPPIADEQGNDPCVIAVARNERVLLPHFLAHYRRLGVRRFFLADNLSDDGSREYLLEQPDVGLYSVDTDYRDSHYGVAWQMALLAHHAQCSWALVADIDEFLVWPGCEQERLSDLCARLDAAGHDAAMALMVDMYPQGPLDDADFDRTPPFEAAHWFDRQPVLPWRLGSGSFSQGGTWVSAVRHRLLPGSPPNHYTAQKLPLMRYRPGVRLSEGLHYASGLLPAAEPVFFAHFKYHRGFRAKVEQEVARRQHFNNAEEYRKYRALWVEARGMMFDPAHSRRYEDSHSFADLAWS